MPRPVRYALAAVLMIVGASPGEEPEPAKATPRAIPDGELSLYPGSVFVAPDPPGFAWRTTEPGESERLPRANPAAPPRVPHGIAELEPLSLGANACLDCHALDAGAGAPELPVSHRTDLRRAPATATPTVAGARWACLACHVPLTDARPLRANSAAAP